MATGAIAMSFTSSWDCMTNVYRIYFEDKYEVLKYTASLKTPRIAIKEMRPLSLIYSMIPEYLCLQIETPQEKIIMQSLYNLSIMFGALNYSILALADNTLNRKMREVLKEMVMCIHKTLIVRLNGMIDSNIPNKFNNMFQNSFFEMKLHDPRIENWCICEEFKKVREMSLTHTSTQSNLLAQQSLAGPTSFLSPAYSMLTPNFTSIQSFSGEGGLTSHGNQKLNNSYEFNTNSDLYSPSTSQSNIDIYKPTLHANMFSPIPALNIKPTSEYLEKVVAEWLTDIKHIKEEQCLKKESHDSDSKSKTPLTRKSSISSSSVDVNTATTSTLISTTCTDSATNVVATAGAGTYDVSKTVADGGDVGVKRKSTTDITEGRVKIKKEKRHSSGQDSSSSTTSKIETYEPTPDANMNSPISALQNIQPIADRLKKAVEEWFEELITKETHVKKEYDDSTMTSSTDSATAAVNDVGKTIVTSGDGVDAKRKQKKTIDEVCVKLNKKLMGKEQTQQTKQAEPNMKNKANNKPATESGSYNIVIMSDNDSNDDVIYATTIESVDLLSDNDSDRDSNMNFLEREEIKERAKELVKELLKEGSDNFNHNKLF